jgi:excisionase family DNA binding protein
MTGSNLPQPGSRHTGHTQNGALRPNAGAPQSASAAPTFAGIPMPAPALNGPQKATHTVPDALSTEVPTITPIPAALLYTIPEVMTLLRLSKTQVFDEIRRGRLGSVKVGRARRVPAECLTQFVALLIHEAQEAA